MQIDTSALTVHFPNPQDGFTTTTSSSVSNGATTVELNSIGDYTDGDVVVLIIDPADSDKKQVFVGTIDVSNVQVTGVKWVGGTNQSHASGATVVDYYDAAHIKMITKGLLNSFGQDGLLKAGAVHSADVIADHTIENEKLKQTIACKVELSAVQTVVTATDTVLHLDNEVFDYGEDFNTTTHRFIAPKTGLYFAKAQVLFENLGVDVICFVSLRVEGTDEQYEKKGVTTTANDDAHVECTGFVEMTAGQYLEVIVYHEKGSDISLNSAEKFCHLIVNYIGSVT